MVILSIVWWFGNDEAGPGVKRGFSLSSALAAAILRRTINATRLIYFLYQAVQIALSPAVALYLLYRGIRNRGYFAGLAERFGFLPPSTETTGAGSIWFHAVSVGEVLSTVELIRRLRAERPQVGYYVSTTTLTGRAIADQKLAGLADAVFFAPLDYRSTVRRVLRRLRPALVVVLETEIWPNLYRESKRSGASLLIVNGRISDRALPRYRRWRGFFKYALQYPDAILAQTDEDRRRFESAGAPADHIRTAGNLKYDFTPPSAIAADIAEFLDRLNPPQTWIAASTMPPAAPGDVDEDDAVIAALLNLPDVFLILAPRKPERFDAVAEKLNRAQIPIIRRSALSSALNPRVLLLDSIGELAALFAVADVVFIGGTLANRGGHNILEPAYFGKPIIVGPHMENFAAIASEFDQAGALRRIDDATALAQAVQQLLKDPGSLGAKARELAKSRRGVIARIEQEVWRAHTEGIPNPSRTLPARIFLTPLSWIWRAASLTTKRQPQALQTPVISIGGLAMGGTGKSPLVAHLATRLREQGRTPAILTRGYRRESSEVVIVARGGTASIEKTGDEAQMFIRSADAHVGIGPDRFAVGQQMERELSLGVFLLDDGFQHTNLARQHDIVLIDALDPLAGGVFPLGRLREPLKALARATEIVITRVEPDQNTSGLERLLARYNAQAPVFRSRVVPRHWVDFESKENSIAGFKRVVAFCGLGSPRSFWRTLQQLGLEVVHKHAFPDHHRYTPADLNHLAAQATSTGADALVTTEKDAINLCNGAAALLAPHRLYWLNIGIEIEREEELLHRIAK
jgi:3-deoxy-D-manno-octulosonic-acid transferase